MPIVSFYQLNIIRKGREINKKQIYVNRQCNICVFNITNGRKNWAEEIFEDIMEKSESIL